MCVFRKRAGDKNSAKQTNSVGNMNGAVICLSLRLMIPLTSFPLTSSLDQQYTIYTSLRICMLREGAGNKVVFSWRTSKAASALSSFVMRVVLPQPSLPPFRDRQYAAAASRRSVAPKHDTHNGAWQETMEVIL